MFKKKPIYIVLLVIFSLVLCVDVASYAMTANAEDAWDGNHNFPQGSENGARPDITDENFDASNMPDGEGFDASNMPSGGGEDFDPSQMPDANDGEMPGKGGEGFDMQQGHGRTETGGITQSSVLNSIIVFFSKFWILIGIVCLLADALCVYMLIRLKGAQSV